MMNQPTAKNVVVIWLIQPEVCHNIFMCVFIMAFTDIILWSSGKFSFPFLNIGLQQCTQKQQQYQSTVYYK